MKTELVQTSIIENQNLTTTINRTSKPSNPLIRVAARKRWEQYGQILNPEAASELAWGSIPDFRSLILDLRQTFENRKAPYSAMQFVNALQKLNNIDQGEIARFIKNPRSNNVLVQDDRMKVVLIHWKPGKFSSIHGHAAGGCVFKVLSGKVREHRYSSNDKQKLMAVNTYQKGGLAYIDDAIGLHSVGNPFKSPAVSIHVYTPGK